MKKEELFDIIKDNKIPLVNIRKQLISKFNIQRERFNEHWGHNISPNKISFEDCYYEAHILRDDETSLHYGEYDCWIVGYYPGLFDGDTLYEINVEVGPDDLEDRCSEILISITSPYFAEDEYDIGEEIVYVKKLRVQSDIDECFDELPLIIEQNRNRINTLYGDNLLKTTKKLNKE